MTSYGLYGRLVCMKTSELGNRPVMSLFSDGVDEILLGILLLLYATVSSVFPRMGFAGPLLLIVCVVGMKWGRSFLRTHVTARRGGYVEPYVSPHRRVLFVCLGALGAAISAAVLRFATASHISIAVLCGATFAAGYLLTGMIYRLPYMFLLAALAGAVSFWAYREGSDLTLVMQCVGFMSAAAGAVKLWRFVRSHPVSTEAEA